MKNDKMLVNDLAVDSHHSDEMLKLVEEVYLKKDHPAFSKKSIKIIPLFSPPSTYNLQALEKIAISDNIKKEIQIKNRTREAKLNELHKRIGRYYERKLDTNKSKSRKEVNHIDEIDKGEDSFQNYPPNKYRFIPEVWPISDSLQKYSLMKMKEKKNNKSSHPSFKEIIEKSKMKNNCIKINCDYREELINEIKKIEKIPSSLWKRCKTKNDLNNLESIIRHSNEKDSIKNFSFDPLSNVKNFDFVDKLILKKNDSIQDIESINKKEFR